VEAAGFPSSRRRRGEQMEIRAKCSDLRSASHESEGGMARFLYGICTSLKIFIQSPKMYENVYFVHFL
jgi:hypothetical protein